MAKDTKPRINNYIGVYLQDTTRFDILLITEKEKELLDENLQGGNWFRLELDKHWLVHFEFEEIADEKWAKGEFTVTVEAVKEKEGAFYKEYKTHTFKHGQELLEYVDQLQNEYFDKTGTLLLLKRDPFKK